MEREDLYRGTCAADRVQIDFDVEGLLKSLETVAESPEGFTTEDLQEATGRSRSWCQTSLKKLMKHGRAKMVGKRVNISIDGRKCYSPVYKICDL